jgi:serine/threonine protein phosphatase 1
LANKIHVAIGDIHGCHTQLVSLLNVLEPFQNRNDVKWVFLGDYVDRGPDVKSVISHLLHFREKNDCVFIKGNHEDMMLTSDYSSDHIYHWMNNGGFDTLQSYGNISRFKDIPKEHMDFFYSLAMNYETDVHFFVHAGVHPAMELDKQDEQDMLWIRKTFLGSNHDWGKIIVHGHSIETLDKPIIRSNRINLDTGCVFGGHLTAGIFREHSWMPEIIQEKSQFEWGKPLIKKV